MQTTIIYITGIYDTLDLFTQKLKNAFETMGMPHLLMMPVWKRRVSRH